MIEPVLFRRSLRESAKFALIFWAVLLLYMVSVVSMYDPEMNEALQTIQRMMPELMAAFGMRGDTGTLMGFLAEYTYGFLLVVLPMIPTLWMGNRLVAAKVDSGAMAYLLAAPISRAKVARTQAAALLLQIVGTIVFCTLAQWLSCAALFPGELDTAAYLRMSAGVLALQLFLGGVSFFASCLFDESRQSLLLGAGFPLLCYLCRMLANIGGKLGILQYATFFSLFDAGRLIANEAGAWLGPLALALGSALLIAAGVGVFSRRDLPI